MASAAHLSTPDLITRMERAHEDANLDDETFELEQRLSARGQTFRWEGSRIVLGPKNPIMIEDNQ